MPSAFPNPIPAWVKGAWHTVDTTLVEPYVSILQYLENLGTSDTWRHLEVHYKNTAAGAVLQDDCWTTFDVLNITGGMPDSSWITSDYTTVEAKFDTFFTAVNANGPNYLTISEYKWYTASFNPLSIAKPFAPHGPPVRIVTKAMAGGTSTYQAAQVALSFTSRTAWQRHWGRNYLPWGGGAMIIAGGRLNTGQSSAAATAFSTLVSSLATSDFQMVVPVTQIDKANARCLMTVTGIQVDDILDVIRRRRPRNPLVRNSLP